MAGAYALEISTDCTVRFAMRVIKKNWRSARNFVLGDKVEKRKNGVSDSCRTSRWIPRFLPLLAPVRYAVGDVSVYVRGIFRCSPYSMFS